jgi:acyl carrier protein
MASKDSALVSSPVTMDDLSSLWKRLLGHDSFEPDDSFFDVGGHSLVANRLCLAIEESFGVRMTVIDVFDNSTLRQQLQLIVSAAA